ncbi:MAG: helix-turn-helix domain-containing protein [Nitrososphaerales archaeon]
MLEAVLQCPQPHNWIDIAANRYSAAVEILDSRMLPNDSVQHLFDIQVKPSLTDDLLSALQRDEDLIDIETMKSKSGHIYGSATSLRCTVCKEVAKSKCFLASVDVTSEGARWTVIGKNDSFRELLAALEKDRIPFEVKLKRNLEDTELLTARQEQILSIGFERGYFDFPKKVGLEELVTLVYVKTSTIAEILRREQKKILGEYLARRSLLHRNQE